MADASTIHDACAQAIAHSGTLALRASEQMFRALAANIPAALWIRDSERQTIQYINPAWQKLTGVVASPGDPLEKAYQAIHPEDLQWMMHERRIAPNAHSSHEYRLLQTDQSVRWVQAHAFPIANPQGGSPLVVEILDDITQRREAQRQLLHLARHDALTDLPNRTLLFESLKEALTDAELGEAEVSVLLLDVDYFKNINDSLGHAIGDAVLREFAARLAICVRPGDIVGRLGGDEFAVVVRAPVNGNGAAEVASRIRSALQTPLELEDKKVLVTTSIGIASYPTDTRDLETLIRYADAAMYDAKASGRDTFRCYTAEMNLRAVEKTNLAGALRFAQRRGEFVLHYQPKMDVDTGQWTSVEALLRWNRPEHGLVLPGQFITALEEMGLIVPVGAWVIDQVCRQIRAWQDSSVGRMRVGVNLSARQVREERFAAEVADSLREHDVHPSLLEFEITEATLMAQGETAEPALRRLRDLGISISIDDFGTGYSNLAYLRHFPIDALKIDMAFIRDITTNPDDAAIAAAMINMAHSLRLRVVAEGVETREQLEFLRVRGCDEVQGYFFSRPLPAEQLAQKLHHASRDGGLRIVSRNEWSIANG